jgi:taurine dioxygenase
MSLIEARPIEPALGAEILGLDATAPLASATLRRLHELWHAHLVLIMREQRLSDAQLLAFSRQFGDLDPPGPNPYGRRYLPDYPEINVVANVEINGIPGNLGSGELVWHADMTYVENPPRAGILHALEVPASGGNTYFANLYLAYERLPEDLKRAIDGRAAIHDATYNSSGLMRKGYQPVQDPRQAPGARHPLIRVHPATARKGLFLGRRRNSYIVGLELAESEAILDALWAHATQPDFVMSHAWRPGDLLIWDNRCTLHRRDAVDPQTRRIMHRTQVREDAAVTQAAE